MDSLPGGHVGNIIAEGTTDDVLTTVFFHMLVQQLRA